jgi:hypothetical protein
MQSEINLCSLLSALSLAIFSLACSPKNPTAPPSNQAFKPLSQRINDSNGYQTDAKGNWVPKVNKRSTFETEKHTNPFKGDYAKKEFKTQEVSQKSWWGNKDYRTQQYEGNTSAEHLKTPSQWAQQNALESQQQADLPNRFPTRNFETQSARESTFKRIFKKKNAYANQQNQKFSEPEITDWREQRSLSVGQSKSILGH